jgi:hypothetical protein
MTPENTHHRQDAPLPFSSKVDVPVFSLEVLMSTRSGPTSYQARLANLDLPVVVKSTPREAIAAIVDSAKKLIRESLASNKPIPWIDPKLNPAQGESRLVVPIHM